MRFQLLQLKKKIIIIFIHGCFFTIFLKDGKKLRTKLNEKNFDYETKAMEKKTILMLI